jgi:hypothetical protein
MLYLHNGVLFSHKDKLDIIICKKVGGTRDCHIKQSKSGSENQIHYIFSYMWNLNPKPISQQTLKNEQKT